MKKRIIHLLSHKKLIVFFLFMLLVGIGYAAEDSRPIDVTSAQMEMLEKGKVVRFNGNVKVVQEGNVLYADTVWHYLTDDRLEAEGNVHYQEVKDQEITDIYGGKMVYERKNGYGVVTVNPKAVYTDSASQNNNTEITGDKIEAFQQEKRALVTGNVLIVQPGAQAKSEKAEYFFEAKKIILTGNPWVWQKTEESIGEYRGKVITLTQNKRVVIEENVQAKITPVKKESPGK